MFRVVFQRRFGKGTLFALALLLVIAAAGTVSAAHPVSSLAASLDTCGYNPAAAPSPGGGTVVFDENTVTRAIAFYGSGLGGHVGVFANDESGLLIGAGGTPSTSAGDSVGTAGTLASGTTVTSIPVPAGTTVAVSSGDSITVTAGGKSTTFTASANTPAGATSIPVNSKSVGGNTLTGGNISDSSIVWGQAVPPTFGTGVDGQNRPVAPTIYLTDITSNSSATGGDWENGGHPATTGASGLYGSWSPTLGTKPVNKNDWILGPNADPIPATDAFGGTTTSFDEGYGAEVAWNVLGLMAYDPTTNSFVAIQPGHTYRAQSMTHDTDQNHTSGGGDVGEVCTTFTIPSSHLTITKTADAASVNAGDSVGFTVEVKNTGNSAAMNANLSDPLPAGSGSGVTWAVDNSTGTPAKFVLSGAKGSQTLGLASSTIPAGADYTIHITATTSATECGTYDNTATLTSSDSNPAPASASEACRPANIKILKTADAAQVSAGDQIGFTLTVYNTGTGDAKGVNLSDLLPTNAGLNWTIAGQGAGWGNTCAIALGTLTCGSATVPASTTLAGSTFTVHITSTTTAATGGVCPGGSGVVNNTGNVTTTNDGSDQSSASTCVAAPAIKILKTPDAAQVSAGDPIGFTLTVWNSGVGDAKGVTLNDPLPVKPGLNWTIANQGAGWNSCAIVAGTLSCGPVTVPAGTTQAGSTFTVHITSPTTAATGGVCPGGSGVVDNTGTVTTTNGGSDQASASTCVAAPAIKILKTADAAQVSAGDPIGFTLTVYNPGVGDAKGVTLNDPLPTNAGLNWTIAGQGSGWASSCSITLGTLNCGPVTVPAGTTQAASTFTVHITSPTTAATGGVCPGGSGVVDNTGTVTTTNGGSDQSTASTCVAAPAIKILKTADAAQVSAGEPIGFTLTVYNTGGGDAKGVTLSDPLPMNAGLSWHIASQGSGWAGTCAISAGELDCGPVTVPAGTTQAGSTFTVHITSPTTAATGGVCPGGSGVVDNTGNVTTTNDGSDQSSASTCVAAPGIKIVKTADAAQVSAGDPIGFTVTVYNTGAGDAMGTTLSDPLPTNPGLAWHIASQGSGWAGSCAIAAGELDCGPVTVPAGTTLAGSTFTVHITSPTTAATGGSCPTTGNVDNTGTVTTTNGGSGQATATTCVAAPAIRILKTADATQVNAGEQIGFTLRVYNDGTGDAKGVTLTDPLPTKPGLAWQIASQGSGWGGTCAIVAGTLSCGPATVPFGTTLAGTTFTVHITSPTTAATAGSCPGGSGVVDNTGNVTTTNDGSDQSTAETCVASASVQIVKTADAAEVMAGDPIGFTLTVSNSGTGDAKGVTVSDPLPTNAGLSWTIANQGSGWNGSCAIAAGTLTCGPATVPAGTTQAGSSFTVHITSPTTSETGGTCPGGSGVVNNTGSVTTTNDGSGQSSASTCVQGLTDLQITKTGSPAQQTVTDHPYGNITWTMVVTNNGPLADTNVTVGDPMPAGNVYVSSTTTKGTCTGGVMLSCSLGTLQSGDSVTIILITTPTVTGEQTNTATVVGDLQETTYTNNVATASVLVVGVTKPPSYCTALLVTPKQLYAGRATKMHITVINNHKLVRGVKVRITGPGVRVTTVASNANGKIVRQIKPKRAGIVTFRPIATKSCRTPLVGVTGVFTPPVTG
jgi:uncharacterized repeat protein (TIGR01451 family)